MGAAITGFAGGSGTNGGGSPGFVVGPADGVLFAEEALAADPTEEALAAGALGETGAGAGA